MNRWPNIIEACIQGNRFAQNHLYDFLANAMLRVVLRYVPLLADAEEVLMNGFLKVFKSLSTLDYQNDTLFEAWCRRIMINEALMWLRQQKHLPHFVVEGHITPVETPWQPPDAALSTETIYEAIGQLPTGYRMVFNLYCIDGYTHEEIANQLKISIGTSKSQLSKARTLLQNTLKRIGYEQQTGTF